MRSYRQTSSNTKYKAKKTTVNGITFDSKREADYYLLLLDREKRGEISDLQLQVKYPLIESQYLDGKCVERAVSYVADFTYLENGKSIVVDVKGFKTDVYKLKRKMFLKRYGFQITEVGGKNEKRSGNKTATKRRRKN